MRAIKLLPTPTSLEWPLFGLGSQSAGLCSRPKNGDLRGQADQPSLDRSLLPKHWTSKCPSDGFLACGLFPPSESELLIGTRLLRAFGLHRAQRLLKAVGPPTGTVCTALLRLTLRPHGSLKALGKTPAPSQRADGFAYERQSCRKIEKCHRAALHRTQTTTNKR